MGHLATSSFAKVGSSKWLTGRNVTLKNLGHPLVLFFVLILALQVNIKQVITALLEKTIQGALVREIPSKALTAEPLLEAHK